MTQVQKIYAFIYQYRFAILYSVLLHIVFVAIFSVGVQEKKPQATLKPVSNSTIPVATVDANKVENAIAELKAKDESLLKKKRLAEAQIKNANQARVKEQQRLASLKKEYRELQKKHAKQKKSVKSDLDRINRLKQSAQKDLKKLKKRKDAIKAELEKKK